MRRVVALGVGLIDRQAEAAISNRHLWQFMGPHDGKLIDMQLNEIRALLKEYGDTAFAPGLKCAIAFSDASPLDERRTLLKELLKSPKQLGFRRPAKKLLDRLNSDEPEEE